MLASVDKRQFVNVHSVRNQLDANKRKDEGDSILEVLELVEQATEQEVELAKTHKRKHVCGENYERISCDSEDGRNRVEGKHDVGCGNRHEHDQHRGEHLSAIDDRANLCTVVVLRNLDALAKPNDEFAFCIFFIIVRPEGLVPGGVEQESTEDVEDGAERFD